MPRRNYEKKKRYKHLRKKFFRNSIEEVRALSKEMKIVISTSEWKKNV